MHQTLNNIISSTITIKKKHLKTYIDRLFSTYKHRYIYVQHTIFRLAVSVLETWGRGGAALVFTFASIIQHSLSVHISWGPSICFSKNRSKSGNHTKNLLSSCSQKTLIWKVCPWLDFTLFTVDLPWNIYNSENTTH